MILCMIVCMIVCCLCLQRGLNYYSDMSFSEFNQNVLMKVPIRPQHNLTSHEVKDVDGHKLRWVAPHPLLL